MHVTDLILELLEGRLSHPSKILIYLYQKTRHLIAYGSQTPTVHDEMANALAKRRQVQNYHTNGDVGTSSTRFRSINLLCANIVRSRRDKSQIADDNWDC